MFFEESDSNYVALVKSVDFFTWKSWGLFVNFKVSVTRKMHIKFSQVQGGYFNMEIYVCLFLSGFLKYGFKY